MQNIEDGLLIGQKEPLVNELERERIECSKDIKDISNGKGEGMRNKMTA